MRILAIVGSLALMAGVAGAQTWDGYAGDPQHTSLSSVALQPLDAIHWQTPVDLDPQFSGGGELLIHYGSPVITADNTVIVPVKTGATGGFELNAYNGATGAFKWTQSTDYSLPPQGQNATYSWTPPYAPTLATGNTLYYAGAGGTVYERSALDGNTTVTPTQEAFYGSLSTYEANQAAYNAGVAISTPITADSAGNIYFGFQTSGSGAEGLTNGIARISASGVGSFYKANQLMAGGVSAGMTQVVTNCAPAISANGSTVYVTMSSGNFAAGRLVALNTSTMLPISSVPLLDPKTGLSARLPNIGTASPMIGPDGDVYVGVYDDAGTSRGWMEHFSGDLSQTKPTGGFGWDDTPSVVPSRMIPSYQGSSSYLIMTKYNNYADPGTGGNGQNMIAVLDPNATQTDTRFNSNGAGGATIMQTVETILGPTPDTEFTSEFPGAVDEWCINSAAVDPDTDSILVNSEDGNMYRWNLGTNALTQVMNISEGLGEAYTPTVIGPDGTAYAINNATLWAVGASSGSQTNGAWGASGNGSWSNAANWSGGIPNKAGDTAMLSTAVSGNANVSLDGNWTVGTLTFESGFTYNVSQGSSGTLTLDNGAAAAEIDDLYGNMNISAPVSLNSNTTIAINRAGDVLTISGNISGNHGITLNATSTSLELGTVVLSGMNSYTGPTAVNSGTLVIGANGALANAAVSIGGTGILKLAANTGLASVPSLTITSGGVLDVNNNHLIINYGLTDPISTIAGYLTTGYAGGAWNGPGIDSSAASSKYGLGYADGQDGVVSGLSPGQLEIAYTLYGDVNLDGLVNATDFAIFGANFNTAVTGWDQGDFNYDGMVNASDFALFGENFGMSANGAAIALPESDYAALDAFAEANGLLTDVPEPGCAALVALAGVSLSFVRRRR